MACLEAHSSATTEWWAQDSASVIADLKSDRSTGLSDEEAAKRLSRVGPNELEAEPKRPVVLLFLAQFASTMIIVLLAAAAVTFFIGEYQDSIVITAIVILNAAIGFVQEYRAERAMEALKTLTAPTTRVVRNSTRMTIAARDVVPGDILLLEAGDVIPADARIIESANLRVDESSLTGESLPVDKSSDPLRRARQVGDRTNMAFKATSVVYGRARAVVVGTGMATELGHIAGLLKAHRSPATPLQKRLAALGRRLAAAAIVICAAVFLIGVMRGEEITLMFLTAVSLAVAAIPEALPAVVTISLALGARRMANQNSLIRRLPAVETLGSVTVICSDKTGTLTQGRMLVEAIWTADAEYRVTGHGYEPTGEITENGTRVTDAGRLADLVEAAVLCNDAVLVPGSEWRVEGDPTEGALLALGGKLGFSKEQVATDHPRIMEIPFDSFRKRMTTVHGGFEHLVACKGAPESVTSVCTAVAGSARQRADALTEALEAADRYSTNGYRVLAVAGKAADDGDIDDPDTWEADLTLYGLVAMTDPPREESKAAVEACIGAGITPVMITGDHPSTARAIASRLGILGDGEVLTGADLATERARVLSHYVETVSVYARTSPEQKLDIVHAWQERGGVVAMTGDGVNDSPALQAADIGVAMGQAGTEVAKEAASMVLTDDNFATIVAAVREGRRIYDNIRRFVRYALTANSGEIWVMVLGPFFGLPLPLLPVQILWINLVTDGLPGLALGLEPPEPDVMKRPPRPPRESIFAGGVWRHIAWVGLLIGVLPVAVGVWAEGSGRPWQTMVFMSLAMLQLGNALAVRSETESVFALGFRTNLFLLWSVLATTALQIAVIYWGPLAALLDLEPLAFGDLAVVLAVSTAAFWAVEAEKAVRRSRRRRGIA